MFGKHTESKKPDHVSIIGGEITPQELERYVEYWSESIQQDIRMYWEHHVNKKTLRRVGEEFGVSHQTVYKRIKRVIGTIADIRGDNLPVDN